MGTRKTGLARDRVQLNLGARAFRHQPDTLAHAKVGHGYRWARLSWRLGLLPAFSMACVDQLSQFAVEATERRRSADQGCGSPDLLIEMSRSLEMRVAKAQAQRARRIRSKPFRIDIEHEEDRAVLQIRGHEIVRFPGIHRDNRILLKKPTLVANVDLRRRPADMEDQMAFAMRMHVEGAVQLINRRAAEPAVEDGKRPAHALPPVGCLLFN